MIAAVFFFQAEDGIRDLTVTGVQTCALPILRAARPPLPLADPRATDTQHSPPRKSSQTARLPETQTPPACGTAAALVRSLRRLPGPSLRSCPVSAAAAPPPISGSAFFPFPFPPATPASPAASPQTDRKSTRLNSSH